MATSVGLPSSFRDPSGFVFEQEGALYRQVNLGYREDFDHLMQSGLYQALSGAGLLIPHERADPARAAAPGAYAVLLPERLPFISYPYEWSFSQLRDAALATLRLQKEALARGMSLKDASAYNIQFRGGKPVLIDTLSFERYREGEPWAAYRQFCQHFLAPLALMSCQDIRLSQLFRIHMDGIPLDLASRLLPWTSRLRPLLFSHIHLHAAAQRRFSGKAAAPPTRALSRFALRGLIDSLESAVGGLSWKPQGTEWADYYNATNYSDAALDAKTRLVAAFLDSIAPVPGLVWDFGANTGRFSRLASDRGILTLAWDSDPAAVEKNYLQCRAEGEPCLLPLVLDLANPSPSLGWAQRERASLLGRGPADVVLALALVHHLAIGGNVPLEQVARFFSECGSWLIVEFVPKEDAQAQRLLTARKDIFTAYCREGFETAFRAHWVVEQTAEIPGTQRTLYRMRKKETDS